MCSFQFRAPTQLSLVLNFGKGNSANFVIIWFNLRNNYILVVMRC